MSLVLEPYMVLRVPFPFTDRTATKNRPSLVLSDGPKFNVPSGHVVLAMITSAANAPWPLDCPSVTWQLPACPLLRSCDANSLPSIKALCVVCWDSSRPRIATACVPHWRSCCTRDAEQACAPPGTEHAALRSWRH